MLVEDVVSWIKSDIVPRIHRSVNSWENLTVEECDVNPLEGMKDNWASSMYKLDLILKDKQNTKSPVSLLVKVMNDSEQIRQSLQSERQFSNEILMYSTIVPLFSSLAKKRGIDVNLEAWFPKCLYTHMNEEIDHATVYDYVIVMEDLTPYNFRLGNRTSLDLKHCIMSLECLGKYHAFSYYAKHVEGEKFKRDIVSKIQEGNWTLEQKSQVHMDYSLCLERILESCRKEAATENNAFILEKVEKMYQDPFSCFLKLVEPKEPFAVVCHGDFLRNNILFRYEGNDPVELKLIDFQTIRYSSPAIDISLFLFMNTTQELRLAHMMDLLSRYHTAMISTLSQLMDSDASVKDTYSWEGFLQDFREHAMFGYLIAIYFSPWMYGSEEELAELVHRWKNDMGSPAYKKIIKCIGGPKVTKMVVDITKELIERRFL